MSRIMEVFQSREGGKKERGGDVEKGRDITIGHFTTSELQNMSIVTSAVRNIRRLTDFEAQKWLKCLAGTA